MSDCGAAIYDGRGLGIPATELRAKALPAVTHVVSSSDAAENFQRLGRWGNKA